MIYDIIATYASFTNNIIKIKYVNQINKHLIKKDYLIIDLKLYNVSELHPNVNCMNQVNSLSINLNHYFAISDQEIISALWTLWHIIREIL